MFSRPDFSFDDLELASRDDLLGRRPKLQPQMLLNQSRKETLFVYHSRRSTESQASQSNPRIIRTKQHLTLKTAYDRRASADHFVVMVDIRAVKNLPRSYARRASESERLEKMSSQRGTPSLHLPVRPEDGDSISRRYAAR